MGLSAVMWVSLVFQAILGAANIIEIKGHKLIRKAQPEAWQDWIVLILSLLAAGLTLAHKPLFPSSASVLAVAVFILTFALLPPLVGVIENRCRADGDKVFALSRFGGHIITNFFGATAVAAFFLGRQQYARLYRLHPTVQRCIRVQRRITAGDGRDLRLR